MSDTDEFVEAIKASVMYGISNIATIIIYGILYFLVLVPLFIGIFILMVFVLQPIAWVIFGLTTLPVLGLSLLMRGFWIQCLRGLLRGDDKMPGLFDDVAGLAVDGVKGCILAIGLLSPMLVLGLVTMAILVLGIVYRDVFLVVGLVLFIVLVLVMVLVSLPLAFIILVQQAVYADTGSLLKGLNPLETVRLVRQNPGSAVMFIGHALILYVAYSAISTVLSWFCVTLIVLPFILLPLYAAIMYAVARFYRQATGAMAPSAPTT